MGQKKKKPVQGHRGPENVCRACIFNMYSETCVVIKKSRWQTQVYFISPWPPSYRTVGRSSIHIMPMSSVGSDAQGGPCQIGRNDLCGLSMFVSVTAIRNCQMYKFVCQR